MITLEGHTALVTGGTMGVGRAIAETLAASGVDVVLHGLHEDDDARQAVATIHDGGRDCHLVTGDLAGSTEECVGHVFDQAIAAMPDIDILISNAGAYSEPDFLDVDFETFDRDLESIKKILQSFHEELFPEQAE